MSAYKDAPIGSAERNKGKKYKNEIRSIPRLLAKIIPEKEHQARVLEW